MKYLKTFKRAQVAINESNPKSICGITKICYEDMRSNNSKPVNVVKDPDAIYIGIEHHIYKTIFHLHLDCFNFKILPENIRKKILKQSKSKN